MAHQLGGGYTLRMKSANVATVSVAVVAYSASAISIISRSKTSPIVSAAGLFYAFISLILATLVIFPVALWERKVSERNRTLHIPICDSSDELRLLAYDAVGAPKHFRNLSRYTESGRLIWTADLPLRDDRFGDAYITVEVDGDVAVANTFHGVRASIDMRTGELLSSTFTK